MEPIDFQQANALFAAVGAGQPQYRPLPAHRAENGVVTSCWRLSPEELALVLKNGFIWVQLHTFNEPLQPVKVQVEQPEL